MGLSFDSGASPSHRKLSNTQINVSRPAMYQAAANRPNLNSPPQQMSYGNSDPRYIMNSSNSIANSSAGSSAQWYQTVPQYGHSNSVPLVLLNGVQYQTVPQYGHSNSVPLVLLNGVLQDGIQHLAYFDQFRHRQSSLPTTSVIASQPVISAIPTSPSFVLYISHSNVLLHHITK